MLSRLKSLVRYFTKGERILWSVSVALILGAFFLFDREQYVTLAASVIGVTSLISTPRAIPSDRSS